jgi:monoterpene epsilon-lactone hydrolase
MRHVHRRSCGAIISIVWLLVPVAQGRAQDRAEMDDGTVTADGAVSLPAMTLPFSSLASPQSKAAFIESHKYLAKYGSLKPSDIATQRRVFIDEYQPALRRANALYSVQSTAETIGGVYVDVITPKKGIAVKNKNRVLINLHGGGFLMGARIMGALESIPVAGQGRIKVVTVDYREGPEYKFPAATEDVIAVYIALLKSYKAKNIGIYGCSAGGLLTAEVMAWIVEKNLPAPGAIGIFCAGAGGWSGGDYEYLGLPLIGIPTPADAIAPPHPEVSNTPYFSDADFNSPLVMPIRLNTVLARFSPTLIITSTRDSAMSSAVYTHTQLVKEGVDAELHVWEGLRHGFFPAEPDVPESREIWNVVIKFFDRHLGC